MSPERKLVFSSVYRCSEHEEYIKRATENHKGKACDMQVHVKNSEGIFERMVSSRKSESDLVRDLAIEKIKAQKKWDLFDLFSLEPSNIAPTWVHMDVRQFNTRALDEKFFVKTANMLEGKKFTSFMES